MAHEEEVETVKMEVKGTKHIPEEIVLSILLKLTEEEDLARFKCVSKQWCCWIRDIIDTRPRKQRLIVASVSRHGQFSFKTMDPKTRQLQNMAVTVPWKTTKIHGSCNGLLLVPYANDLFLWNPLTRYNEKIFSFDKLKFDTIVGGLCFDSAVNEYKVVVAVAHNTPGYGDFVAVGSPKNKSWTHIQFPYRPGTVGSGPVLYNRLHWFASTGGFDSRYVIVYFDTDTDTFLDLPMPLAGDVQRHIILGLGALDGCLCMTRSEDFSGDTAEVLLMKEYGVRESWTVLFRISGVSFYEVVPLFYTDEGKREVCMKVTDHYADKIIVYDIKDNSQIQIESWGRWESCSIAYEVTSERPIRGDWEELDSRGEAFYIENYGTECIRTMKRHGLGSWIVVKEETMEFESQQYHFEDFEEEDDKWEVPKRSMSKMKSAKCDSVDRIPMSNTFDILRHCPQWFIERYL